MTHGYSALPYRASRVQHMFFVDDDHRSNAGGNRLPLLYNVRRIGIASCQSTGHRRIGIRQYTGVNNAVLAAKATLGPAVGMIVALPIAIDQIAEVIAAIWLQIHGCPPNAVAILSHGCCVTTPVVEIAADKNAARPSTGGQFKGHTDPGICGRGVRTGAS